MWPTSVLMPVAVTIISPRPRVTLVFMKAMSTRSPSGASASAIGVELLGHRGALAGQGRLVDLQGGRRAGSAPSAGTRSPASISHDVAGDELVRVDLDQLAVATHAALDDHHLLQGGDAGLGLALLVEPQDGVEQGQAEQQQCRVPTRGDEQAHDGRAEQDDLHRVLVLAQERLPARLFLRLGELVRPVLRPSPLDLGAGQARRRVDALRLERLVGASVCQPAPSVRCLQSWSWRAPLRRSRRRVRTPGHCSSVPTDQDDDGQESEQDKQGPHELEPGAVADLARSPDRPSRPPRWA